MCFCFVSLKSCHGFPSMSEAALGVMRIEYLASSYVYVVMDAEFDGNKV